MDEDITTSVQHLQSIIWTHHQAICNGNSGGRSSNLMVFVALYTSLPGCPLIPGRHPVGDERQQFRRTRLPPRFLSQSQHGQTDELDFLYVIGTARYVHGESCFSEGEWIRMMFVVFRGRECVCGNEENVK
jgi:hypothetical protein